MLARTRDIGLATAALIVGLAVSGCAGDRLLISSSTVIGIDANLDTTRTAGRVQIGFDRYFVAWLPQTVQESGGVEAMSALNCTDVIYGTLTIKKFDESLATGRAAVLFAKAIANSQVDAALFDCFASAPGGSK
jgi:hypothetical protein